MTLDQLAKYFGYNENSFKANYKRTIRNLAKKGIFITKTGYGNTANYEINYGRPQNEQKNR